MDIVRVAAIPYTIITPGVVAFHFALAAVVLARADLALPGWSRASHWLISLVRR